MLDLPVQFWISEYEKNINVSNGNRPLLILDCVLGLSQVLKGLETRSPNEFLFNADYVVKYFSVETVNHLMAISEIDQSIITLKIENYSKYGNSILEVSNSIFALLSQIPISSKGIQDFKGKKDVLQFINHRLTNKGGCYIATMAYGSYDHPQVIKLRHFRDNTLSNTKFGLWLIEKYYFYSPKLVERLQNKRTINYLIRKSLNQLIKLLS